MPPLQKLSKVALIALLAFAFACGDDDPQEVKEPTNQTPDMTITNNVVPDMGASNNPTGDMGESDSGVEDDKIDVPEGPFSIYERGPYNVGYRRGFEVTYDAVGEPGRSFRYVIWYPTRDREGELSKYFTIFRRPEAFKDAELGIDEPAPILVFSHGNSSFAEQSYFMTEWFATHGWIVVAPDHTGNTFSDTQGAIDLRSGAFRPQDITALLDDLEAMPEDDPIQPYLTDDIVMTGHSFGGYTTLASSGAGFAVDAAVSECMTNPNQFCDLLDADGVVDLFRDGLLDPRIDVAIPQTPGGFFIFQEGIADIDIPTLMMTGELDRTLPNDEEGDPLWNNMEGPHMRLNMPRGGHFTFSNMCELFGDLVPDDGCGDEFIEFEPAFEIINAFSMAFARYHLFGDESHNDLLTGTITPWGTEVQLSWKPAHPLSP